METLFAYREFLARLPKPSTTKKEMSANDSLFIRARYCNPTARHKAQISIKWDELNSHFDKYGIDREFSLIRAELKALIKRYPDVDVNAMSAEHPDSWVWTNKKAGLKKFKHGYNLKYSSSH